MEELKPRQLEYMSHQPKGHTAELILSNSTARLFPPGHFTSCTTKDMGTARVSTNHMDPCGHPRDHLPRTPCFPGVSASSFAKWGTRTGKDLKPVDPDRRSQAAPASALWGARPTAYSRALFVQGNICKNTLRSTSNVYRKSYSVNSFNSCRSAEQPPCVGRMFHWLQATT